MKIYFVFFIILCNVFQSYSQIPMVDCRENVTGDIYVTSGNSQIFGVNVNKSELITIGSNTYWYTPPPAIVTRNGELVTLLGIPQTLAGQSFTVFSGGTLTLSVKNIKLEKQIRIEQGSNVKISSLGCVKLPEPPKPVASIKLILTADGCESAGPYEISQIGTLNLKNNYHFEIHTKFYDADDKVLDYNPYYHGNTTWTLQLAAGQSVNGQNLLTVSEGNINFPNTGCSPVSTFGFANGSAPQFNGHPSASLPQGFCSQTFNNSHLQLKLGSILSPKIKFDISTTNALTGACDRRSPVFTPCSSNCGRIGEEETINQNQIIIHPNPSTGIFTLQKQSEEAVDVVVYDVLGQVIWSQNGILESSSNINLSRKPSGIYQVRITSAATKPTVMKLVLE